MSVRAAYLTKPSDYLTSLPTNTPIKPLRNGIFSSSCALSTIFQIENKSIDHDFLLLAGKVVVVVVRMKLISGCCVSMNSEAELQCIDCRGAAVYNEKHIGESVVSSIGNTYPLDVVEEGKYQ